MSAEPWNFGRDIVTASVTMRQKWIGYKRVIYEADGNFFMVIQLEDIACMEIFTSET